MSCSSLLALGALFPLVRFRWPSREEGLSRLDRGSGIRHRPATALTDTLTNQDPVAQALWQAQRERTLASIKRIRAGLPSPRLAIHDPWALRALVAVMMVATYVAAGDERSTAHRSRVRLERRAVAGQYPGRCLGDAAALYRQAADHPVGGEQGSRASPRRGRCRCRRARTLIVRSSGGTLDVVAGGGVTEAAPTEQAPKGTNERHFTIAGDGTAQVRAPSGQPQWKFTRDSRPRADHCAGQGSGASGPRLAADVLQDRGRLRRHRSAGAFCRPPGRGDRKPRPTPRPLFDPPQFPLVLPNARTRNGVGQTVKDLSEDPYAGADVTLTLTAKDEAGNEGRSEPFNMRLPERLFTKPLARALIEQRRILALDANQNAQVYAALDALMIAPELFTPEAGQYLGLYSVARQLEAARTDDALREVVASLWALAVTIEDGDITDVDKALRAAQDALKQALERGASDEEIKKLTENLRAALDNFMRQLAEQLRNNPQALARPLDPNTRVMRQQDLNNMIERMERLSRSGDKEAAKQLLEQLQEMLENLQMAQPGQSGDGDMEQALNELGDMIRKQQQLRDKTFKQGQDSRRDRARGKQQGDQSMGDLQQDQQGLRDRLKKLQQELAKRGMGQGQKRREGPAAASRASRATSRLKTATARTASARPTARWAMPAAGSARATPTARWIRRARRWRRCARAPRASRRRCSRATATGRATAPAIAPAGSRAAAIRAIRWDGRCMGANSATISRSRSPARSTCSGCAASSKNCAAASPIPPRPQIELDYIERLLKDY